VLAGPDTIAAVPTDQGGIPQKNISSSEMDQTEVNQIADELKQNITAEPVASEPEDTIVIDREGTFSQASDSSGQPAENTNG
jgi:hypothetical protein